MRRAADKEAVADESKRMAEENRGRVRALHGGRAHEISLSPEVVREQSRRNARKAHDLLLKVSLYF